MFPYFPTQFAHSSLEASLLQAASQGCQQTTKESKVWPSPEQLEASLDERPLELLCEHSMIPPAMWQTLVWDEARRSFAFHWPGALDESIADQFLERLTVSAPWQPLMCKAKEKLARSTVWWTRNKACNCAYTYGEDISVKAPDDELFHQTMEDLVQCVFSRFPTLPEEAWPNCANLNLYSEGSEGVGWHSDDELIFMGTHRDCPILSLSLGGKREFWIALQADGVPDARQGIVEVDLNSGDLLTMEGLMQKHCMHQVPRANSTDESRQQLRINVTFRWMRLHKPKCPYAKVAETWCMLARAAQEEQYNGGAGWPQDGKGKGKRKNDRNGGVKVLDPLTQIPLDLEGPPSSSSRSSRRREKNLTAVMSPAPSTARALFGEGARKFYVPPPRPNASGKYLHMWPSRATKWQACDACGHTCWGGGRLCEEGEGDFQDHWFCRCCWRSWAEEEDANAFYQVGALQYGDNFAYNGWM